MATLGRKVLLACGAIGPPLFVAAFLREGSKRADYDPRRHPVSSLALGERGWVQSANFLLTGTAIVAFSRGVRPAAQDVASGTPWESRLLGLAGIGLIGAGLFPTDPVFGYPSDMPLALEQSSARGHLHNLFSLLLFAGLPGACLVEGRRFARASRRGWAAYSLLTGIGMPVTFVLAGLGFAQSPRLVRNAGVFQRLSIASGLAWITLRVVQLLRTPDTNAQVGG